jgi:hypothetical protein
MMGRIPEEKWKKNVKILGSNEIDGFTRDNDADT